VVVLTSTMMAMMMAVRDVTAGHLYALPPPLQSLPFYPSAINAHIEMGQGGAREMSLTVKNIPPPAIDKWEIVWVPFAT
jgi:hypothetical protein